jgi:ATP-dependent DNA ligase
MLATLTSEPFHKAGWVYEEKYDGDRILAYKEDDRIRLLSRSGEDRTDRFPGIVQAILNLEPASLLLDGEVVVFDKRGVSRFQLLQQGGGEPFFVGFALETHTRNYRSSTASQQPRHSRFRAPQNL